MCVYMCSHMCALGLKRGAYLHADFGMYWCIFSSMNTCLCMNVYVYTCAQTSSYTCMQGALKVLHGAIRT